jgi:peptide deformylase
MALPPIVQAGHPALRAAAAEVPKDYVGTREFRALVDAMVAVMRAAPGVGLAAPQIGVGLQIIVLEDAEALMSKLSAEEREARGRTPFPLQVIVNPRLTVREGAGAATFFEGCLSVKGYMALVERDLEVEVTGLDQKGAPFSWQARGWPARILQHEVDHLRGTLYIDRMLSRTFCCNEEVVERWFKRPIAEVIDGLDARRGR